MKHTVTAVYEGIHNNNKHIFPQRIHASAWQVLLSEISANTDHNLQALAAELSLSTSTIRRILGGKAKRPTSLTFSKILSFYCANVYLKKADAKYSSHFTKKPN